MIVAVLCGTISVCFEKHTSPIAIFPAIIIIKILTDQDEEMFGVRAVFKKLKVKSPRRVRFSFIGKILSSTDSVCHVNKIDFSCLSFFRPDQALSI